ncbi:MAG TPA: hypothetical protein VD994_18025 [Prosthecobacter sp.]|nr:hypothetical protein [Prosthecobacter sp.]
MQTSRDNSPQAILIDQLFFEVGAGRKKVIPLWRERLRLYQQPKPRWMPVFVWVRLLKMVFKQTVQVELSPAGKQPEQEIQ